MVSHWAIGVPIIMGTLIGTLVLAIPRQHYYSRPPPLLTATGKRKSKEELIEDLLSRTAPPDDYEMKPVVNE